MSLTPEREALVTKNVDTLLRKHPQENAQYSPFMNPPHLTIERFKAEVDPQTDITPQEVRDWCNKMNEVVPYY